jgi:HAD superfamily hydrolase (TIGR01509 family)
MSLVDTSSRFTFDGQPLLLFDLGGVLIENVGFESLNRLLPSPIIHTELKERWLRSPSVRDFESGKIDAKEFSLRFIDEWKITLSADNFIAEFSNWPKGFYPGAKQLLKSMRRSFRIACLSNSNTLHWSRFGNFEDVFDIALSSHLLGVLKPDCAAFERALSACGVRPEEVIFFDDSFPNVKAAENLGIRAFHVEGFTRLRGVLSREGIWP